MSITDLFIRRPVMTTLVMLGIVLFGVMGYRSLAVSDLPNVDFPTIQVQCALPGASVFARSLAGHADRVVARASDADCHAIKHRSAGPGVAR